jgi:hypothetical protein
MLVLHLSCLFEIFFTIKKLEKNTLVPCYHNLPKFHIRLGS